MSTSQIDEVPRPETARAGVFVNYRRDDTGATAGALAAALRLRVGPWRSVSGQQLHRVGEGFPRRDRGCGALQRCPVRADRAGLGRYALAQTAGRRAGLGAPEIELAQYHDAQVVPVLVDRDALPCADRLPAPLQFSRERQFAHLYRFQPGGVRRSQTRSPSLPTRPSRRRQWCTPAHRLTLSE